MQRTLLLVVLSCALLMPLPVNASTAARAAADRNNDQRLLVTLAAGTADAASPALAALLSGAQQLSDRVFAVSVRASDAPITRARLLALPTVEAVESEGRMPLQRVPNDPRYADQWAHSRTGIEQAWDITTGGSPRVAVIDSGMLGNHPELSPNVSDAQVSTATGTAVITGTRIDNDPCQLGHGTFVGGVIGARGDNMLGVAGVAWQVSLLDISAISPDVGCDGLPDSAIIAGMRYAIQNPNGPVDVINMSFGRPADRCPAAYQSVINDARAAGIVVVAAAGNGEGDPATSGKAMIPGSCNGVISVAATRKDDGRAAYSTANPFVDMAAPGGDSLSGVSGMIISTSGQWNADGTVRFGYAYETGTSHAAPYVSGAAALIRAANRTLNPAQIESVLEQTAKDLARPGRDSGTGWGLVQLGAALTRATQGQISAPAADPNFPYRASDPPWTPPTTTRVSATASRTTAISQAVAVSRVAFSSQQAFHAVLARADDFADALAGSALGNGLGPLLFTPRTGPLAGETRTELQRVLRSGGKVYLLGGTAALPATLEQELRDLSFEPVRLSGPGREFTAAAVADEVDQRGLRAVRAVLLARSDQWPDAVAGGSLAAWFGMPVLLTAPDNLHPATADALQRLQPDRIYALGGNAAISPEVLAQAGVAAGLPEGALLRLAGPSRSETAVAIAQEMEALLRQRGDAPPNSVLAINVRRSDGFAHALSASVLSGATAAVMVPVEGINGTSLTTAVRDYLRGFGVNGLLMGGGDVLSTSMGSELETLLRGVG